MKKNFFLLLSITLSLSSCKTNEKLHLSSCKCNIKTKDFITRQVTNLKLAIFIFCHALVANKNGLYEYGCVFILLYNKYRFLILFFLCFCWDETEHYDMQPKRFSSLSDLFEKI